MGFVEENNRQRMAFVDLWAKYVREHDDRDWSRQQNVIIDSALRGASMSKADYLRMMAR